MGAVTDGATAPCHGIEDSSLPGRIASRLSICAITLRTQSFLEQAQTIAMAGCRGMGVFHPLIPPGMKAVDVRDILDANGLQATICVPKPYAVMPTEMFSVNAGQRVVRGTGPPESILAMIDSLRWLSHLRPSCVVVMPGAQGARSRNEAWDLAVGSIRQVAKVAADLGLTLAVEPVHPRFSADFSILSDIDSALTFIDDVQMPSVGLLVETFHVWEDADLAAQIQRSAGRIVGVQLSDSTRFARSLVDRVPPGEGVVDLAAIVALIEETGYRGWYDVEIASDDGSLGYGAYPDSVWRRSPREIASSVTRGATRALLAAGL